MQAKEIEIHLAELGAELQEMGIERPIRILLVWWRVYAYSNQEQAGNQRY